MKFANKWAAWCVSAMTAAMMTACVPGGEQMNDEGAEKSSSSFLRSDNAIPNQYIVVLRDDLIGVQSSQVMAEDLAEAYTGRVTKTFNLALNGFVAEIEDEEAAIAMSEDPRIAFVEEDAVVTINADQSPATWGIDRIDQNNLPLNNRYTVDGNDGEGVHVYILDTGIRATHNEFIGRVGNGYDTVDNDNDPTDCHGHGTHVAGTAAGSLFGVAKQAIVHGVRIMQCNGRGSQSDIIAGIDWVTQNFQAPAVANMSISGGASVAQDEAVQRSIAAGVTYVVAAGNATANACNFSPARTGTGLTITVGSTTETDARRSDSNYGPCLDLFAPGDNITSAWYQSDDQLVAIGGTSMASPHVAGVAALYLARNPDATPAQVSEAILAGTNRGLISDTRDGSPNLFLNTAFLNSGVTPPPPPPPPEEEFDFSASLTRSARSGTANQNIALSAGQTLTIGTCGVGNASFDGDTYLRLYLGGIQVALNDDNCGGFGSQIIYTAPQDGTYQIRAGCYSNRSCGGTVAWTIQ